MKTKLTFAIVMMTVSLFAQSLTSLQTLTSVAGTNSGTGVTVSGVHIPAYTFHLQTLGITNTPVLVTNVYLGVTNVVNAATNAVTCNIQFSLDNTNWIRLATFHPLATNAAIDALYLPSNTLPVYLRSQVITTNALTVGVMKQ